MKGLNGSEMKIYPYNTAVDYQYRRNISSKFSRNSEAFASEFLENLEEIYPRCCNSYISRFKSSTILKRSILHFSLNFLNVHTSKEGIDPRSIIIGKKYTKTINKQYKSLEMFAMFLFIYLYRFLPPFLITSQSIRYHDGGGS